MDNNNNEFRGSTENAVQSKVKVDINKVLQEAYETTKHKRTAIAGAIVWASFILIAAIILVVVLTNAMGIEEDSQGFMLISYAVQIIIISPLAAGIQLMALRNVLGGKADINQAFVFLGKPWLIIAVALITTLISQAPTIVGFEHFTVFAWALFFQITFALAIIITATGQASPLNAALLSFNVVVKRFVSFLILNIVLFIITMLLVIPVVILGVFAVGNSLVLILTLLAGVAAIYAFFAWALPTYLHAIAILYRDIFAVKPLSATTSDDSDGSDQDDSQSFNA